MGGVEFSSLENCFTIFSKFMHFLGVFFLEGRGGEAIFNFLGFGICGMALTGGGGAFLSCRFSWFPRTCCQTSVLHKGQIIVNLDKFLLI